MEAVKKLFVPLLETNIVQYLFVHTNMFDTVWPLSTTSTCLVITIQSMIVFDHQTSPISLQLLRPFDYKCPQLLKLMAKSRQDKEYLDMAEQSKVSRFQTTVRVV